MATEMPAPDHPLGYTTEWVRIICNCDDKHEMSEFLRWIHGQTVTVIDDVTVYYTIDFQRWYRSRSDSYGDPPITD